MYGDVVVILQARISVGSSETGAMIVHVRRIVAMHQSARSGGHGTTWLAVWRKRLRYTASHEAASIA